MRKNSDDITRNILNTIRGIQETSLNVNNTLLNEATEPNTKAIAITDDPKFGDRVLSSQIQQFRSAVEGGTQFNKPEQGKVAEAPLIFMPETGNLIFSGIIPCLNNLKWQFVLKTTTGNGCFLWSDGMILSKDNLQILSKLFGYYCNWRDEWNQSFGDLERMANNILNK